MQISLAKTDFINNSVVWESFFKGTCATVDSQQRTISKSRGSKLQIQIKIGENLVEKFASVTCDFEFEPHLCLRFLCRFFA